MPPIPTYRLSPAPRRLNPYKCLSTEISSQTVTPQTILLAARRAFLMQKAAVACARHGPLGWAHPATPSSRSALTCNAARLKAQPPATAWLHHSRECQASGRVVRHASSGTGPTFPASFIRGTYRTRTSAASSGLRCGRPCVSSGANPRGQQPASAIQPVTSTQEDAYCPPHHVHVHAAATPGLTLPEPGTVLTGSVERYRANCPSRFISRTCGLP